MLMKNQSSILMLSAAILLVACGEKKKTTATVATVDSVQVFTLKKETITKKLVLPAELYAWQRAEVRAKVEGYIKELKVDIGDKVKRNDILAVIDAPEVASNYAKAAADLQATEARYRTSADTYRRLVTAAKERGSVSDSEMERTRNQMLSDSATFVAAQSGTNAYAQLRSYLVIRAAFDGIITQRNIDPGTLVGSEQKPLFVLENLSTLRLRVAVPEAYTSALPDTSFISFTVDAQPSKKYIAKLARKSNQIDAKTRTELWEFIVDNTKQELKSGMYGNVNFNLHRAEPSFVVPYSAVVTNLERNFVIRVKDGKPEWIDVKSGINLKDKVEVFGELQEGDQLLVKANDEIKEDKSVIAFQKK